MIDKLLLIDNTVNIVKATAQNSIVVNDFYSNDFLEENEHNILKRLFYTLEKLYYSNMSVPTFLQTNVDFNLCTSPFEHFKFI